MGAKAQLSLDNKAPIMITSRTDTAPVDASASDPTTPPGLRAALQLARDAMQAADSTDLGMLAHPRETVEATHGSGMASSGSVPSLGPSYRAKAGGAGVGFGCGSALQEHEQERVPGPIKRPGTRGKGLAPTSASAPTDSMS